MSILAASGIYTKGYGKGGYCTPHEAMGKLVECLEAEVEALRQGESEARDRHNRAIDAREQAERALDVFCDAYIK